MDTSNYLLDTHVLLWFQLSESKIPQRVLEVIQDQGNNIFFSQVSLYEIAIKQKTGKLPDLRLTVEEIYHQGLNDNFTFLPISNQHIFNYQHIPLNPQHRDPFDRLLIATANHENAIMITRDDNFSLYTGLIQVLW
jgi:PIN domain nuclease of toxin-antitoxin system